MIVAFDEHVSIARNVMVGINREVGNKELDDGEGDMNDQWEQIVS